MAETHGARQVARIVTMATTTAKSVPKRYTYHQKSLTLLIFLLLTLWAEATSGRSHSSNLSNERVSLDLSGRINCHVAAPGESSPVDYGYNEDGLKPLFQIKSPYMRGCWKPPSLLVGINYNFNDVWYGMTRMITTLRWKGPSSTVVEVGAEKGMQSRNDYSAQVAIKWNDVNKLKSSRLFTARMDTEKGMVSALTWTFPIHRRIDTIFKSLIFFNKQASRDTFTSRIPRWTPQDQNDSWIPELKIGTTGRLASKSELGLNPSFTRGRRTGMRLTFSRQIDWFMGDDDSTDATLCRFEVCCMDKTEGRWYSSAIFDAELERIVETGRLTLSWEQAMSQCCWKFK